MTVGSNAPQMYQYPLRLEGPMDNGSGDRYFKDGVEIQNCEIPCTIFEMKKIVEAEWRKIEMLVGKFLFSGFNVWTE